MRMMDELKHLYLYSANKKVYAPIDEKDKRRNSAVLLLSPDMDTSLRLTKLPYIYNPGLINAFYIDRNVDAYIANMGEENIEFDEQEAEAVSEAMINWNSKVKFKFDDRTSIMDQQYIREVFNHEAASHYAKELKMNKVPDKIKIVVHPNLSSLRKDAPKQISNIHQDNFYSYTTDDNTVHLLSKMTYDPQSMCGSYEIYLISELVYTLIHAYNPDVPYIPAKAIGYSIAGLEEWMKREKRNTIEKDDIIKFSHTLNIMRKKYGLKPIQEFIKSGDINILTKYTMKNATEVVSKLIFESELSYFERQRLLPSDFGIPDKRKYPIHDEDHVRAAIRMFNNCDPDDEEELAESIIKRINKFGMTDIKVSASNRFRKYYKPVTSKKESTDMQESTVDNGYENILKICNNLSDEEFKRITFYDTYRDSKFVIKRIICKSGTEPAGFLDVYHFPSNPKIAQIVIAVDERFRGMGVAQSMVSEMLNCELHNNHDFDMYYWTAHTDNYASQSLAMKNGFIDTNQIDKYGRKVFIRKVNNDDNDSIIKEAIDMSNDGEDVLVTENMAMIFEGEEASYSQKLRKYLYSERIKNNKEVSIMYDRVRESNPNLKKMYLKIKMYKKLNVFVDLSYYHGLFLRNNPYRMDKGVNMYFDLLKRLINNREIDSEYTKKTIFIPIDTEVWNIQQGDDILDYKKNLNPISIICRLVRTNLGALRDAFGNKDIIFLGSRGYFTIDFNKFDAKDVSRLKVNLRKLMSKTEKIEDDYDIDAIPEEDDSTLDGWDMNRSKSDSTKGMTMRMIDKIENKSKIKIDNVSGINSAKSTTPHDHSVKSPHLRISNTIEIDRKSIPKDNGIAIITIDPDGPNGFKRLSKTPLSKIDNTIEVYCLPN